MSEQLESDIYFRYYVDGIISKIEATNMQMKMMQESLNAMTTLPDGQIGEKVKLIKALQESPAFIKLVELSKQK
ncbi:hypothetical protein D5b_00302 [Faustovirus]|nr:hypothetical protein D5b_00302 [Faustovirus]